MSRAIIYFDGSDRNAQNVFNIEFSDDESAPLCSTDELIYDVDACHWKFPIEALRREPDLGDDVQPVSVPRENVYRVIKERKVETVSGITTAEDTVEILFNSLPGEYTELTNSTDDFLEVPSYNDDTEHWQFVHSDPAVRHDGQRLILEQHVPRERVLYAIAGEI